METQFAFAWQNASQSGSAQEWRFSNGQPGFILNTGQSVEAPPEMFDSGTEIGLTVLLPDGQNGDCVLALEGTTWLAESPNFTVNQAARSGQSGTISQVVPVTVTCRL